MYMFHLNIFSRVMKNPFNHPPGPFSGQEGAFYQRGKSCIWGIPPDPCQRGFAPLDFPFSVFSNLLGKIPTISFWGLFI